MSDKLEEIYKVIGQSTYELLGINDPEDRQTNEDISKFLSLGREAYILVQWPNS